MSIPKHYINQIIIFLYSEEFPTDGVVQAIMNRLLKSAGYKTIKA